MNFLLITFTTERGYTIVYSVIFGCETWQKDISKYALCRWREVLPVTRHAQRKEDIVFLDRQVRGCDLSSLHTSEGSA